MKMMRKNVFLAWPLLAIIIVGLTFVGCSIKFVADYDATTFEEIIKIGKKVDRFYGDLLEAPANSRQYQKYSDEYVEIETDLRSLVIRNKARELNAESTEISEIILKLWMKYKANHAARDGYADGVARLDRGSFTRLFTSAADAETAKKLDADDKDPGKESRQPI